VSGVKESNMDKGLTSKKERREKVSGTWAKESSGLRTNDRLVSVLTIIYKSIFPNNLLPVFFKNK